jgi:hypothetical protein
MTRAVETGTSYGNSTATLAAIFPEVITIELSPELHAAAVQRFAENPRVTAVHGESGVELARYVDSRVPTVYYLDAHWCYGDSAGEEIDCPIRDELRALSNGNQEDCVVIDDARLFRNPPPGRNAAKWPPLEELAEILAGNYPEHSVSVVDDQVIAAPPRARLIVEAWEKMAAGDKRPVRAHLWRLRPARLRWRLRSPLAGGGQRL